MRRPERSANDQTTWGPVADWYGEHLSRADTFHEKVIRPNIIRFMSLDAGMKVLDVPSGEGYFSRVFAERGAEVFAVDIAPELVGRAERAESDRVRYFVSPSHSLPMIEDRSIDRIAIILGIQNIDKVDETFGEFARVLKHNGSVTIVMNHPAFRIPKASSWGWDKGRSIQYRRIDAYLSESRTEIDMHPGKRSKGVAVATISFHRPIQWYFKFLGKRGFAVDRLEEWISHKESVSGPRKEAENIARNEFPLFLAIRAVRMRDIERS